MADEKVVRIEGLRELNKALKKLGDDAPTFLKVGFRAIAENVASHIRPKVPHISGRAASSVKARGSTRGGAIAFGGSKAPYYPWLDFGGGQKLGRGVRPGGGERRPFITEGRYVYPTISAEGDEIRHAVGELVEAAARKGGFETRGGD